VCLSPAVTEAKPPAGGVAWPRELSPQQTTVSSLFNPHVCNWPAVTEAKLPAGGVPRPYRSAPQQATEPSLFTPHVCSYPALTVSTAGKLLGGQDPFAQPLGQVVSLYV
jgi:hypothetical protein